MCGNATVQQYGKCSICYGQQQKGHSRQRSGQSNHTAHTPPPSESTSVPRARQTSASIALHSAFSSDDDQPILFPSSIYRTPPRSRSCTKAASPCLSASPTTLERTPSSRQSADDTRLSPDNQTFTQGTYSPMAAGFARLSRKDGLRNSALGGQSRSRSCGARGAFDDLERRMFAGPA